MKTSYSFIAFPLTLCLMLYWFHHPLFYLTDLIIRDKDNLVKILTYYSLQFIYFNLLLFLTMFIVNFVKILVFGNDEEVD